MPITPTTTQSGFSFPSSAELAGADTTALSDGEWAYTSDTKTTWRLDRSATSGGVTTPNHDGRWIAFGGGGGNPFYTSGAPDPNGVVTAAEGTFYVATGSSTIWINGDGTNTGWWKAFSFSVPGHLTGSFSDLGFGSASGGDLFAQQVGWNILVEGTVGPVSETADPRVFAVESTLPILILNQQHNLTPPPAVVEVVFGNAVTTLVYGFVQYDVPNNFPPAQISTVMGGPSGLTLVPGEAAFFFWAGTGYRLVKVGGFTGSPATATAGVGPNVVYDTSGFPGGATSIRFPGAGLAAAAWRTSVWNAPFENAGQNCVLWYDAPADGTAPPLQVGGLGVLYPGERGLLTQTVTGPQLTVFADSLSPQSGVTDWYLGNATTPRSNLFNGSASFPLANLDEVFKRTGGSFSQNTIVHVLGVDVSDTLHGFFATNPTTGPLTLTIRYEPVFAAPQGALVAYTEHNPTTNQPSIVQIPLAVPQPMFIPSPIYLLNGANQVIDFGWLVAGDQASGTYQVGPWRNGGVAAGGANFFIGDPNGSPDGAVMRGIINHDSNMVVNYVHVQPQEIGLQAGDIWDSCFLGDQASPIGGTFIGCFFTGSQTFNQQTTQCQKSTFFGANLTISNATLNVEGALFFSCAVVETGGGLLVFQPGADGNSSDIGVFNGQTFCTLTDSTLYLTTIPGPLGATLPALYGGASNFGGASGPAQIGVVVNGGSRFMIDAGSTQPTLVTASGTEVEIGTTGINPNPLAAGIPQPNVFALQTWADLFGPNFGTVAVNLALGASIGPGT